MLKSIQVYTVKKKDIKDKDVEDMMEIVERDLIVFSKENFWINPDRGLKTRDWEKTKAALENLVELAKKLRKENKVCHRLNRM